MAAFVKGCREDIPILINIKCKYYESCDSRSSATSQIASEQSSLSSYISPFHSNFPWSTLLVSEFLHFTITFVACLAVMYSYGQQ